MNKVVALIALLASCFSSAFSQSPNEKQNLAYAELGGNGLLLSINYERKLFIQKGLTFHIGAGVYGADQTFLTIPFGFDYLINLSNQKTFLDIGLGATYTKADVRLMTLIDYIPGKEPRHRDISFIPGVSLRHYTKKDWMIRFGITPVFNQHGGLPLAGISFGKLF